VLLKSQDSTSLLYIRSMSSYVHIWWGTYGIELLPSNMTAPEERGDFISELEVLRRV
jgi:hypothetical protein